MQGRRENTVLWIVLVAGGAFAGGLFLGDVVGSDTPSAKGRPASSGEAGEALEQLALEVRQLRTRLEARIEPSTDVVSPPTGSATRSVIGGADSAEIVAALEPRFAALETAIAEIAAQQNSRIAPLETLQYPSDDFEPLPFPVRDELSTTDFSRRHLYWTAQQVVDAYGLPGEVSATRNNEHVWSYPDIDGEDLEFVLHEGVVLRVEW